jgi:hypothetical protein
MPDGDHIDGQERREGGAELDGDSSRAPRKGNAHRLGKRWPSTACVGETLQDRLPFRAVGELERDPAVEIDLLKPSERRIAPCPPRIRQVLLGRVRDCARP